MKKELLRKLSLLSIIALLVMPCMVFATGEDESSTPSPSPSPTETTNPTESPKPSESPSPSPTTTPTPSPSETPDDEKEVEVTSVSLKLNTLKLVEGETKELTATISPSDATNKTITWSSSDEKVAKVNSKGVVTAVNKGTATIVATSSNGKKANCEVTVTKKEVTKSSDYTLKSLKVTNGKLDKEFDPEVYEYTVTVDKTTKELCFDFEYNYKNDKYYISNNNDIISGQKVKFFGVAEDGTKNEKPYVFIVKKEEANLNLKSLKIKGYALNETFKASKLEYTAEIPYEAVDVTIETAPEDSEAKVKITGATGLIVGENTVIVTVTDTSGNKREYKIKVTRLAEDEREETNNSSKYTSITSDSNTINKNDNNSKSNGPNHTLRYVCVTIGCVILFLIGAIGVYFYIITSTNSKKKKNKKNKDITNNSDDSEIEESPLIETKIEAPSIMPGDLEETREFTPEDIINKKKKKNEEISKNVEELLDE